MDAATVGLRVRWLFCSSLIFMGVMRITRHEHCELTAMKALTFFRWRLASLAGKMGAILEILFSTRAGIRTLALGMWIKPTPACDASSRNVGTSVLSLSPCLLACRKSQDSGAQQSSSSCAVFFRSLHGVLWEMSRLRRFAAHSCDRETRRRPGEV